MYLINAVGSYGLFIVKDLIPCVKIYFHYNIYLSFILLLKTGEL